jgi:hypothetical protein
VSYLRERCAESSPAIGFDFAVGCPDGGHALDDRDHGSRNQAQSVVRLTGRTAVAGYGPTSRSPAGTVLLELEIVELHLDQPESVTGWSFYGRIPVEGECSVGRLRREGSARRLLLRGLRRSGTISKTVGRLRRRRCKTW